MPKPPPEDYFSAQEDYFPALLKCYENHERALQLALTGRLDEAFPFALAAKKFLIEHPDTNSLGPEEEVRLLLAEYYRRHGPPAYAHSEYQSVLQIAEAVNDTRMIIVALEHLKAFFEIYPLHGVKEFLEMAQHYGDVGLRHPEGLCLLYSALLQISPAVLAQDQPIPPTIPIRLGKAAEILEECRDEKASYAYYRAASALWEVHGYRPGAPIQDSIFTWLGKASRLGCSNTDLQLFGMAKTLTAAILLTQRPSTELNRRRAYYHLRTAQAAYASAGLFAHEADVVTLLAVYAGLGREVDPWLDNARRALRLHEKAWAQHVQPGSYILYHAMALIPSGLGFRNNRGVGFRILAIQAATAVRTHPNISEDPRWPEVVWGLECATKAQEMAEELHEPLWHTLLARDDALREFTTSVERARLELEKASPRLRGASASEREGALDRLLSARKQQFVRLTQLAREPSGAAIRLACAPPVRLAELQSVLQSNEQYVGLIVTGSRELLRSTLTSETFHIEVVRLPSDLAIDELSTEDLSPARLDSFIGETLPDGRSTVIICPDWKLAGLPWHFYSHADVTSVVPSAGILYDFRVRPREEASVEYFGISGESEGIQVQQVNFLSEDYFGRDCPVPQVGSLPLARSDLPRKVKLLHFACHAYSGGLRFNGADILPVSLLSSMSLKADILLMTACNAGRFIADEENEFFGVVRALLAATDARAAVINGAGVPGNAALAFSGLLAAALTGRTTSRRRNVPGPLAVGRAVEWARGQLEGGMSDHELDVLMHSKKAKARFREPSWWDSWFVFGDPEVRLV